MITISDLKATAVAEAQQFQEYKNATDAQLLAKDQTIAERDATIIDLQGQLANVPTQDQLTDLNDSITNIVPPVVPAEG